MKQIIIILLALITFEAMGQKDGDGKSDWGPWYQNPCFKGLSYRFRCLGYVKSIDNYTYQVQVKNDYPQLVHYDIKAHEETYEGNFEVGGGGGRFSTKPGELQYISSWYGEKYSKTFSAKIDNVCFFNDNNLASCIDNCYAQCDARPKVPNQPDCSKKTNTNNSSNSYQNQTSTDQTNSEIDNLNEYLTRISDSDPEKQRIIREVGVITASSTLTDSQRAARIKTLTGQAKARAEQLDGEETARKTEEDRQRKILEERDNTMRSHVQKGDDAYNSGQYANAKIHYSNALNFATTDQNKQEIQAAIARAQQAIEAEQRKQRIEQKQKVEQQNNTAAAAGIASGLGILALLEDEESDGFFSAKFRFGLGIEWVPLLTNSTMKQTTRTDILTPIMLNMGLKLVLGNDKPVSAHVTPEAGYGLMAFSAGSDGSMYNFGGMVGIHAGRRAESLLKVVGEAGYIKRGGSYNYDGDVASGGTTATDDVYNGEFNYGITRLGGGVLFQAHDGDEVNFFIKPMYYFDKFSFAPVSRFTQMLGVSLGSTKIGIIDLMFSKNYGIAGSIDYPQTFNIIHLSGFGSTENESYFQFRYSRQIKLK